jgi:hypothetical protein
MDRRRRILVNPYEEETDTALAVAASKYNARVCPKLRVADALEISQSGLTNEEYSYALRAHFDFVLTQDGKATFAVEFDGSQHDRNPQTILKDTLKNSICEKLGYAATPDRRGILAEGWSILPSWLVNRDVVPLRGSMCDAGPGRIAAR